MKTRIILCLACLAISGCQSRDDGPHRVQVSGKVTWNGQPLEKGMIHLLPVDGPQANMSGAEITNGAYLVSNKGGLFPGVYRVEFTANRPAPPVTLADGSQIDYEQYLPKKFNEDSKISLTVPDDVSTFKHDFDLME